MFVKHKAITSTVVALLVSLGLLGGAGTGYVFREPIKKAVQGKTTTDEINDAVTDAKNEDALGKSKFELEGIAASVDATNNIVTVKIKSSTNSIKELRLSETPIAVTETTAISMGDTKEMKIADVPIDSQVHVGGTIKDGKLTAAKIIIQKESGLEKEGNNFSLGGTVKEVGTSDLTVTVKTANKKSKDKKGTDLKITVDSNTVIEKGEAVMALSEIKVGDTVQVTGVIESDNFTASKIEVKIIEEAGTLEEDDADNGNSENKNKQASPSPSVSPTATPSSSANSNSNSNRGGNSNR